MKTEHGTSKTPQKIVLPLIGVIVLAALALYLFYLPVSTPEPGPENEEVPFYIGTWSGLEPEYQEEFIVHFDGEGLMYLLSPQYGYGTEFIYHAWFDDGKYYLEIFDAYNEEWELFFLVEQDEGGIMISIIDIGEFIRAAPEDEERFTAVMETLEHFVSPMEMIYGTLVETGFGLDEDDNIIEKRDNFAVDEAFFVFFDNGAPFNTNEIIVKIRDAESGLFISQVAYDVDPGWTAMISEEPFILSEPGNIELLFIVDERVRAIHKVSAR